MTVLLPLAALMVSLPQPPKNRFVPPWPLMVSSPKPPQMKLSPGPSIAVSLPGPRLSDDLPDALTVSVSAPAKLHADGYRSVRTRSRPAS